MSKPENNNSTHWHCGKCKEFIFYSSDGIVTRLGDRWLRGQHAIPGWGRNFVFLQNVQTSTGAHPASYTMDTESCFTKGEVGEAAVTCGWPLASI